MFFSRLRASLAGSRAILEAVAPLRLSFGEIPDEIWRHPYALGYLNGLAANVAHMILGPHAGVERLGDTMKEIWKRVSPLNHGEILERIIKLHQSEDAQFFKGQSIAGKVVQLAYRSANLVIDEDVLAARRFAREFAGNMTTDGEGSEADWEGAAGAISKLHFIDVIKSDLRLRQ